MGFKDYVIGIGKRKRERKKITQAVVNTPTGKIRGCKSCGQNITPDQKYTKQIGYYFHRECWKKERKAANI